MSKIKKHFYNIETKKINKTKIVLLSDIHYYNKEDYFKLEMIYNSLKEIKPDYITIAGDLLDNAYISDTNVIYSWLKDISLLATVIISIGNHDLLVKEDFEAGFDKKLFDKIDALDNVYVLNDKSLLIDNINFLGITLPASYYYETHEPKDYLINYINNVFPKIDKDNYNILLCHSPLRICNKEVLNSINIKNNLDLILCGHTHGGITPEFLKPILKNIGLISPFRRLFFKNAYGKLKIDNTNIIISSGITKASHRNRFHTLDNFFAREITIIEISNNITQGK